MATQAGNEQTDRQTGCSDRTTGRTLLTDSKAIARKPLPLLGTILVWVGALIWCFELLMGAWPSGLYFLLIPIGLVLTIAATIRRSDWRPFALTLAAVIPPVIALAIRGLKI